MTDGTRGRGPVISGHDLKRIAAKLKQLSRDGTRLLNTRDVACAITEVDPERLEGDAAEARERAVARTVAGWAAARTLAGRKPYNSYGWRFTLDAVEDFLAEHYTVMETTR